MDDRTSHKEKEMRPFMIDVALVPTFVEDDPDRRGGVVYVVVDVIRATTSLAVAFTAGCRRGPPAPDNQTARGNPPPPPRGLFPRGGREGRPPPSLCLWQPPPPDPPA